MNVADTLANLDYDRAKSPFFALVHDRLRQFWAGQGPRIALIDQYTEKVIEGAQLTFPEARSLFQDIVSGNLADDQIGALLVALQPERIDAPTLAAFATVMRDSALPVRPALAEGELLGDTCGTGSDSLGTFNVSTTIAFILAAAGLKIAKHGNIAVTSRCGSADVLRELGVRIDLDPGPVEECISEVGVGFMFAPVFHRAFSNVQRIRKMLANEMPEEVKRRTVFNVLGPLANPARVATQLLGVYSREMLPKFAEVLRLLEVTRALVVFGECEGHAPPVGLDECSTAGVTHVAELKDSQIRESTFAPEDLGLDRTHDATEYRGGDTKQNADILTNVLAGRETGARMDLALVNAGAGLYVGGKAESLSRGVQLARDLVRDGAPLGVFERFRDKTRSFT